MLNVFFKLLIKIITTRNYTLNKLEMILMRENNMSTTSASVTGEHSNDLERSIDWKQGLAIASGVPLLILPSLGYFPLWVASAAILIWGLSVLQGFMQNLAYAELETMTKESLSVVSVPGVTGLHGIQYWRFLPYLSVVICMDYFRCWERCLPNISSL